MPVSSERLHTFTHQVAEDLSVVGYDDLPVARWVGPPLTTIRQPLTEMAEEATRLFEDARGKLNELIAGTDMETFYGPIRFASEGDHFHNRNIPLPGSGHGAFATGQVCSGDQTVARPRAAAGVDAVPEIRNLKSRCRVMKPSEGTDHGRRISIVPSC
jgi:hypothetical protein